MVLCENDPSITLLCCIYLKFISSFIIFIFGSYLLVLLGSVLAKFQTLSYIVCSLTNKLYCKKCLSG